VFAILYVAIASYTLYILCENLTDKLARSDAQGQVALFVEGSNESRHRNTHLHLTGMEKRRAVKRLQYTLIKRHFKTAFALDVDLDFVFYLELSYIFGITSCFTIGIVDWLVLFLACLLVVKPIFMLANYKVFTLVW
jgi:hypothetical protein